MTRPKLASTLCLVTAGCHGLIAVAHGTHYQWIADLARQGPPELLAHVMTLWFAYCVPSLVLGGIIALHARNAAAHRRAILVLAGCFPLATVILLVRAVGFFGPEFPMATLAALCFVTAAVCPKSERTRCR